MMTPMMTAMMILTNNHQPAPYHTPSVIIPTGCYWEGIPSVLKHKIPCWNIIYGISLFQKPWRNLLKYPVYRILYYSPKCHCLSETSLAFGGVLFIKFYKPWYFQITEPVSDNNKYRIWYQHGIERFATNHFLNSNRLALSPVTRTTSSLLIPLILPISSATSGRFNEQFLLPL